MGKIKIAEFFGEPLNYGGQETFIINIYSKINKDKFEFTFITPFECKNEKLKEMIKKNGDRLIYDDQPFESKLRKKYIINTAKKHINTEYDVIHIHSGSIFTLYNVAKIAKNKKVKKVIVHSHAAGKNTIRHKIIKMISNSNIGKYADCYFACSKLAGESKFSKEVLNSNKFKIIRNGIDLELFKYDEIRAKEYKKKFDFQDKKIIIHVGRFSKEKNQLFILDVFKEVIEMEPKARLVLVGGMGNLYNEMKNKIEVLELNDKVTVLTNRNDVNELINMSDVFILPSLWEGLPFTGIEAQANGIPCIFSDTITEELNVSKSYNKLSIKVKPIIWAEKICELFENYRNNTTEDIKKHGFDVIDVCKYLEKIYGEINGNENYNR